ncbi:hypothetical protein BJ742DRAFT_841915 [Cladochytrium replicatum]|nr:hypothetical protein BJ742DRAFT_841915 [Cladochytrium replicatum]
MLSIAIKTLVLFGLFGPALSLHQAILCCSFLCFVYFRRGVSPLCHISDSRLSLEQAQRSSTQSASRLCIAYPGAGGEAVVAGQHLRRVL